MARFNKSVLANYGIQTGTAEVLYNPSYEVLFNEETQPLRNIITTTTAPLRRHGRPARSSLRMS